jgi:hypothetical protein
MAAQGTARTAPRHGGVRFPKRTFSIAAAAALLLLAACSAGASPTPITTANAVSAVLAQDPLFRGLTPLDPDAIGRSGWYEVEPAADSGYVVRITLGWGDCPAGCINRHAWEYAVNSAGAVSLLGQSGDPLPDAATGLRGTVKAGPSCPVVMDPPDPACADRPVAGAIIVVTNADGGAVMQIVVGADGTYDVPLGPGVYTLTPLPVEGFMGTPAPQTVRLEVGDGMATILFWYDTGIR